MALLAVGTALLGVLLQRTWHPGIPFGIDMDLWSFSAIDHAAGHRLLVPPAYPTLTALLAQITGVGPLRAATAISAGAMAAVPPLAWLLARRLGAGFSASLVAALAPLLTPGLLLEGHQVTPTPSPRSACWGWPWPPPTSRPAPAGGPTRRCCWRWP